MGNRSKTDQRMGNRSETDTGEEYGRKTKGKKRNIREKGLPGGCPLTLLGIGLELKG